MSSFGERAAIISPARQVQSTSDGRDQIHGAEIIYVHAKVAIADDARAIVSSANLNGHSLRWDSEAGVVCDDPDTVAALRRALFRHWLRDEPDTSFTDPRTAAAAWRALAQANAALAPERRTGLILPHDPRPAREIGIDVPGAPEEIV